MEYRKIINFEGDDSQLQAILSSSCENKRL